MAQTGGRPKIKSLSQMYVFYESLKDEHIIYANGQTSEGLYNAAVEGVEQYAEHYGIQNKSEIAANLISMSENEKSKELNALRDIFGVNINIDLNNPEDMKSLVVAFNSTLNLKSNFERNLTRIKNTKGEINVASLFDKYFKDEWDSTIPSMLDQIEEVYCSSRRITVAVATEQVLSQRLPEIVKGAIKRMFSSGVLKQGDESGLEQLLDIVDTYKGTNDLVRQLIQAYGLDEIGQGLRKTLRFRNKQKESLKNIERMKKAVNTRAEGHYQKGGLTLEYLENYIASALISGNISNNGIEIKIQGAAMHTGSSEIKADNIYTFGFDNSIVGEVLETVEGERVSRERNIEAITKLTEKLKTLKEGYIIYSSAKNYSLSENFKGFSQGSPVSVATLKNITGDSTKLGAILQTAAGAVGRRYIEDIRMSIAEDIAYYLFDDISTVGTNEDPVRVLHIFDLDGIFIPLSILLFKIGKAIEEAQKAPASLISVDIKAPHILYDNVESYSMEMWDNQRKEAMANTKVSAHFFKDFFNFMKQF